MINTFVGNFLNSLPDTLAILIVLGFSLLALVLAILISFVLIRIILKIKWKSQTVRKIIRIINEGNVNEKFLVRFNLPKEELNYRCLLEGVPLQKSYAVERIMLEKHKEETPKAQVSTSSSPAGSTENQSVSKSENPNEKEVAKKKLGESANKAKEKSKKGLGFLRLVSGILSSFGSLIPGSVGRSLKEKSGELQKASQDASTKMQMPEQKLRSVDQLKGQVKQITPEEKEQNKPSEGKVLATNEPIQVSEKALVNKTPVSAITTSMEYREVSLANYLETPALKPGDTFNLELSIDPLHPYRTAEYFIEVFVRQMDSKNKLLNEESSDSKSNFIFSIAGLSPIFWILSFLLVLSTVVINSTWTILFISWLARFVI